MPGRRNMPPLEKEGRDVTATWPRQVNGGK